MVIRPKGRTAPLPALFEFTLSGSRITPRNARPTAMSGSVAFCPLAPQWSGGLSPFEHDGDDARAVIRGSPVSPGATRVGHVRRRIQRLYPMDDRETPPPALKAIATSSGIAPGISFPMEGGIYRNSAYRWSLHEPAATAADRDSDDDEAPWSALDETWYRGGRRYRDLGRLFGRPILFSSAGSIIQAYDRYWQKLVPYREQFAKLTIPVLTTTGYYAAGQAADLYFFSSTFDLTRTPTIL